MTDPRDSSSGPASDASVDSGSTGVRRRRWLAALGTGLATVVSGCTGLFSERRTQTPTPRGTATPPPTAMPTSTSTDTPESTATETETPAPRGRHVGVTTVDPTRVQYNPHNPSSRPAISHHVLFEPLARYSYGDGELLPAAVESWTHRGDALELRLREGLTWSDGSAVTATDLATQFRIGRYVDDPMWDRASGVRVPGERRVVLDLDGEHNPDLLERVVLADRYVRMHRDRYGRFLETLRDGGTVEDLRGFADRDPITCGPFHLVDRNASRLVTERFGGHPDASAVGFAEYVFEALGAEDTGPQLLASLAVDSHYSRVVRAEVARSFPDAVSAVTTPAMWGGGLVPNHAHEHAGDRAVRRAVAFLVDRNEAVRRSTPLSKEAPPIPTGLATSVQTDWLGEAWSTFETYGRGASRTDRAREVLEAAGYERRNGNWVGPDGAAVSLPVTVPDGWVDWRTVADQIVADLSSFGFDAAVEPTDAYGRRLSQGDFVLAMATWLPDDPTPHPYHTLAHQLWRPGGQFDLRYRYPGASTADAVGGGATPVTVQSREGGGESTVDVRARLDGLERATDDAVVTDAVRDLAWVANRDLPMIPVVERYDQQWLTTDEWAVPPDLESDPDANVRWAATWLPRVGKMRFEG